MHLTLVQYVQLLVLFLRSVDFNLTLYLTPQKHFKLHTVPFEEKVFQVFFFDFQFTFAEIFSCHVLYV
jgi:hypothetical protein